MSRFLAHHRHIITGTRQNASKTLNILSRSVTPINFVPQQEVYIVERFGKYARSAEGGLMFKIPFVENVAYVQGRIQIVITKLDFKKIFQKK